MAAPADPAHVADTQPTIDLIQMDLKSAEDSVASTRDVPVKRDPAVPLLSPLSGTQSLVWSQDHRLAVCTASSLAVMELVCDIHSRKQELIFNRTSIPVPLKTYEMRVGAPTEQRKAMKHFTAHSDLPTKQEFQLDRVMNPLGGVHKGIKYASWSPLGCDSSGRCLLACLTLDHRLTVHHSHQRLGWSTLVDLSAKYGEMLQERGYAQLDAKPPEKNLLDFEELQWRYQMQTPVRMEWSGVYTLKQVQPDNSCVHVKMVLLAVLMENGDLVLWKFALPFENGADVVFYDAIASGVSSPSDLAWWEYEHADRRMSGLIVGSELGPVTIMPVSLAGVKGYFTLRHPVILWKECDRMAAENIKCVPLVHPLHKTRCSLIVASRGCYVLWCLLTISPAGLNVNISHLAGLYSLPVVSLAVSRHGVVYTCSTDGWIKKLTPKFTERTLTFQQEEMLCPEGLTNRRLYGIAVSHNEAYLALVSTQRLVDSFHPILSNYHVHFLALKLPETAAGLLLKSPTENLYKEADLLDLVRWNVLKNKSIPRALQQELEQKIREVDSPYLWRLKLFLLRFLHQSLQTPQTVRHWKPSQEVCGALMQDQDGEEDKDLAGECHAIGEANPDEQVEQVRAGMRLVESHLVRENMKKLLGEVYLNTHITQKTCIPTSGLAEHLLKVSDDKNAEVLIGHIKKKMNKQTFPECCSLCQEVLPFTDHKQAVCQNGHMWLRCVLSYQACQSLTFRRCLLQDSISGIPQYEDPPWIKKILQTSCSLCDSPMI
ncbi:general transcription factor 3C polypeptide 4 isoform X1 [Hippocampus comes]|uniref:general transcription factor 3C polypeptide 4 isoform X1 n=1 Tax=Hippocampus comes TaxID=109280 RepID=UPI00094EA19B|nr:PREDICTED: general transcription factor 3C polypeptide 4 isoform X1 [Hippocampus comes]